jgi:AraC-like DNA-binding protein
VGSFTTSFRRMFGQTPQAHLSGNNIRLTQVMEFSLDRA